MVQVSLHDAKARLSRLVERAAAGEEIVIAKAGRPLARLVPLAPSRAPREFGFLAGRVQVGPDFDAPLPDELQRAFDMLAAQARVDGLTLVSEDAVFAAYDVRRFGP